MKFHKFAIVAALGAALAQPLSAQSTLPSDCLANTGGAELARVTAEDALADSGFGQDASPEQEAALFAAMDACAATHSVEAQDLRAFSIANLAYMVGGELRSRMLAAGMNMDPIETLSVEFANNPNLNIETYIDSRPDQFERPFRALTGDDQRAFDLMLAWTGFYIAMRSQQIVNERLLAGQ